MGIITIIINIAFVIVTVINDSDIITVSLLLLSCKTIHMNIIIILY